MSRLKLTVTYWASVVGPDPKPFDAAARLMVRAVQLDIPETPVMLMTAVLTADDIDIAAINLRPPSWDDTAICRACPPGCNECTGDVDCECYTHGTEEMS